MIGQVVLFLVLCVIASSNADFQKSRWPADMYDDICNPKKICCAYDEVCVPLAKKCPKYGFYLVGYCITKEKSDCHCDVPGFFCALFGTAKKAFKCTSRELLDPCKAEPCKNGGVCTSEPNSCSFDCDCPTCFKGPLCEKGPCSNVDCGDFGTCKENLEDCSYRCVCQPRYTGKFCETKIEPCKGVICPEGQRCTVRDIDVGGQIFTAAFCLPVAPKGKCPVFFRPELTRCDSNDDCPEGFVCCVQNGVGICLEE